jgi:site-specific DNA-adenine methylase
VTLRLFRYSGNKAKLLSLYRPMPTGAKRIVEPYLGSGAFLLNSNLPAIGYEINKELVAMWHWLQKTTAKDLQDLNSLVEDHKKKQIKPDVRDMKLDLGPQTYVRVNACSVVVGQLSSWKVYPQNSLPIEETIRCLPRLKDVQVIHANGETHKCEDGDFLFVDPPYIGTVGNYVEKGGKKIEKSYDPSGTINLLNSCSTPAMLTYGTNASTIFPMFEWELVKKVKVPNMRKGGTVDRSEFVSYIRMNHPDTLKGLFS